MDQCVISEIESSCKGDGWGVDFSYRGVSATEDLSCKWLGAGGLLVQAVGTADTRTPGRRRDWKPGRSIWTLMATTQLTGEEEEGEAGPDQEGVRPGTHSGG